MTRIAQLLCLGIVVMLSACTPSAAPQPTGPAAPTTTVSVPTGEPAVTPTAPVLPSPTATPTTVGATLYPTAVEAARATAVHDWGVPPSAVTVVSYDAVDWRNGCLELDRPGVMCTDALKPGYRVILAIGDQQYEYRTDRDGSQVLFAGPA